MVKVQHRHFPLLSCGFQSLGQLVYLCSQMRISFGWWYPFLLEFHPVKIVADTTATTGQLNKTRVFIPLSRRSAIDSRVLAVATTDT